LDTKENALHRFIERGRAPDDPSAAELVAMYDRLRSVVASRPTATVVHTTTGQVDRAYRDILAQLTS
jgi:hypothetical protein